jgi:hypothetical protein
MTAIEILIDDEYDTAERMRYLAEMAEDDNTRAAFNEHAHTREQIVERLRERAERVAEVLA